MLLSLKTSYFCILFHDWQMHFILPIQKNWKDYKGGTKGKKQKKLQNKICRGTSLFYMGDKIAELL